MISGAQLGPWRFGSEDLTFNLLELGFQFRRFRDIYDDRPGRQHVGALEYGGSDFCVRFSGPMSFFVVRKRRLRLGLGVCVRFSHGVVPGFKLGDQRALGTVNSSRDQ